MPIGAIGLWKITSTWRPGATPNDSHAASDPFHGKLVAETRHLKALQLLNDGVDGSYPFKTFG